ncbi:MAG: hypothetical protein HN833_01450 [Elusimicrobiaceae bacterium]|nr:hypothetical protein [Elusimicrobiaceae bacterium]MBT4008308.1 hypothetical protein [Elusimicrobiaceae bacterium]MBT4440431.1 hypothetical protein [Elusimicrobiaceae bacterium]MBT5987565.1 hypothetical protein [Elusimicrobiaceae bacterium]MBT7283059.1 hypothetical protein [Elusimicrobiaceae bacterium]
MTLALVSIKLRFIITHITLIVCRTISVMLIKFLYDDILRNEASSKIKKARKKDKNS